MKKIPEEDFKKTHYPDRKEDRVIITGVHPMDKRNEKKIYDFWASDYLIEEFPCPGDIVNVNTKDGKSQLFVLDVKKWHEGCYEPKSIARRLYRGKNFKKFKYDIQ